jgi:hypothetical protein
MMTTESELSKSIYMSYGGNIQNIGRDGMMEDYHATPEEEAEWKKELLHKAVQTLMSDADFSDTQMAINTLEYHNYEGLKDLLISKAGTASPNIKILCAGVLWKKFAYAKSFDILVSILEEHKEKCREVFYALGQCKDCAAAEHFVIESLQSQDRQRFEGAKIAIGSWAYSGFPQLRSDGLLDTLNRQQGPLEQSSELLSRIKMIVHLQ